MNDGTVRRIAWRQLCPWLLLFQAPRLALRLPVMFLAFAAVMLTPLGWWVSGSIFSEPADASTASLLVNTLWPGSEVGQADFSNPSQLYRPVLDYGPSILHAKINAWQSMMSSLDNSTSFAHMLFGSLWTLLVWSFFGAAISRIAVAHFGCGEQIGIGAAMRFAGKRFRAIVSAPLMPLVAMLLLLLVPAILGWLMSFEGIAAAIGAVLWGASILAGGLATLLAVGIFFGWPLMVPTIAAERNGDSFEALSRAYAYCTQRPLHLFLYATLASILGGATWVLVLAFFGFLLHSTSLAAVNFGANPSDFSSAAWLGAGQDNIPASAMILRFWTVIVRGFAVGFHFSFFWSASSAIYLLLRSDLDQTDFDEIDLDQDEAPLAMPKISPTPAEDSGNDESGGGETGSADSPE